MCRSRLSPFALGVCCCVGGLVVCLGVHAQEESRPGLVLRANVRRVLVDVVVTDVAGKPVRGLRRDDFSLEEDGKPQFILNFDKHELERAQADYSPHPPALPANTYLNLPAIPEQGPLYILLLDLMNTGLDDQMTARSQLLNFIKSKPAGTRFATFVLSDDLYLVQGFTADPSLMFTAADPHRPTHHVPMAFLYGGNFGAGNVGVTLEVFHRIAQFVDGLPGRKNIIWLSGTFPLSVTPTVQEEPSLATKTKALLDTLARNQVSIYPVDVRGVVVVPPGLVTALQREYDSMDQIAKLTGGKAFYSNNGVTESLEKATEQGGNYYTLSYSPTNHDYNGRLRNIELRLSQKGYTLAYRHSYFGTEEKVPGEIAGKRGKSKSHDTEPLRPVGDSLFVEMQHGAPLVHDLLFKVHVHALGPPALATPEQMASIAVDPAYFQKRHNNKAAKAIPPVQVQTLSLDFMLPASQLFGKQSDGEKIDPAVEIAAAAYDGDGKMLNGSVEPALQAIPFDPAAAGEPRGSHQVYRVQQQIDVPAGSASIRIAVRDMRTDNVGAIELPLPLAPEPETTAAVPPN